MKDFRWRLHPVSPRATTEASGPRINRWQERGAGARNEIPHGITFWFCLITIAGIARTDRANGELRAWRRALATPRAARSRAATSRRPMFITKTLACLLAVVKIDVWPKHKETNKANGLLRPHSSLCRIRMLQANSPCRTLIDAKKRTDAMNAGRPEHVMRLLVRVHDLRQFRICTGEPSERGLFVR
jgi:hypothetical protein